MGKAVLSDFLDVKNQSKRTNIPITGMNAKWFGKTVFAAEKRKCKLTYSEEFSFFTDCNNSMIFGILGLFQMYFLCICCVNPDIIDIQVQNEIRLLNDCKKAFFFFDWSSFNFKTM